ncbi:MAG: hypothetical protein ACLSEY_14795 [Enterocloster sp.]
MERLGADVELMGMVGDDIWSDGSRNELEKYGASPESMTRKGVGTYSVTLHRQHATGSSFTACGANDTFTLDDIDLKKCKRSKSVPFWLSIADAEDVY